jgi:hypothetical protein
LDRGRHTGVAADVPYQNLMYVRSLFDKIEGSANDAIAAQE